LILYPPSSVRASDGDEIVIICHSPFNVLYWKWQNETMGSAQYRVFSIGHSSQITPNIPVEFPGFPGVTIKLLTSAKSAGGTINSSLQLLYLMNL